MEHFSFLSFLGIIAIALYAVIITPKPGKDTVAFDLVLPYLTIFVCALLVGVSNSLYAIPYLCAALYICVRYKKAQKL